MIYESRQEFAKAIPLLKEAYSTLSSQFGAGNDNALIVMKNLGRLYGLAGDHKNAEETLRACVNLRQKHTPASIRAATNRDLMIIEDSRLDGQR